MTGSLTHAQRRIKLFLESMGQTSSEVANFLRRHGCRGTHSAFSCPVAVALERKFRGIPGPVNNSLEAGTVSDGCSDAVYVKLPAPVRDFTYEFDRGLYADLYEPLRNEGCV